MCKFASGGPWNDFCQIFDGFLIDFRSTFGRFLVDFGSFFGRLFQGCFIDFSRFLGWFAVDFGWNCDSCWAALEHFGRICGRFLRSFWCMKAWAHYEVALVRESV